MTQNLVRQNWAFQNISEIPLDVVNSTCQSVIELDLTSNRIRDLKFLLEYVNLQTLVLDHNLIGSHVKLPELPALHTLWVNHNKIDNLKLQIRGNDGILNPLLLYETLCGIFIDTLARKCPNLQILSMMNNEAAPSYFNSGTKQQYMDYRSYVISKLPKLMALDDKKIDKTEREEAERIYRIRKRKRRNDK